MKLYVFDCGRVRFNDEQLDAFDFGFTAAETDVRELIVPCYVIEHDRGRLLWDGGLASATADTEGRQDADGLQIRLDRTLGEQLAEIGLDFTSFDYMAFSHMSLRRFSWNPNVIVNSHLVHAELDILLDGTSRVLGPLMLLEKARVMATLMIGRSLMVR